MDLKERVVKKFRDALGALEQGLGLEGIPGDVKRDMVLLRFELAAELMPKALKRTLEERGVSPALPKDVVRSAVAGDLVPEDLALVLLEIIDDRNRMVHDYSASYADNLYKRVVSRYVFAFKELARLL